MNRKEYKRIFTYQEMRERISRRKIKKVKKEKKRNDYNWIFKN